MPIHNGLVLELSRCLEKGKYIRIDDKSEDYSDSEKPQKGTIPATVMTQHR